MNHPVALTVAALVLAGSVAHAQTTPPAQTAPPNAAPSMQGGCAPSGQGPSNTVGTGQSDSNLSDKLASSNGVICPPAGVDPDMRKPAPGGGNIVVVPPPGGPGGDPKVIPK
jgi:hypothetical protein